MPACSKVVNIDSAYEPEPGYYSYIQGRVESAGGEFVLVKAYTEDDIIAACGSATVVLAERAEAPLSARVIESLPQCIAIMKCSVGMDYVDFAAAARYGIVVCNAAGFCAEEVSDHAVALVLSCARRIHAMDRNIRRGGWFDFSHAGSIRRVRNSTLGLIGFGAIGRAVARKMSGFQMPILVTDPYAAPQPGVEFVSLERLLKESDLVSVQVPLSDATRNLLGKAELRAMKPSAILVNTSRGGVLDGRALGVAVQERWISGAGPDVMVQEPLPLSSPLRDMDNVVLTPHYAGHSDDSMASLRDLVAGSVEAVLKGYWPPFPANPEIRPRVPLQPWKLFEETRAAG